MKRETMESRVDAILEALWEKARVSRVTHQDLKLAMASIGLANDQTHDNWIVVLMAHGHIRLVERRPLRLYEVRWPARLKIDVAPEVA